MLMEKWKTYLIFIYVCIYVFKMLQELVYVLLLYLDVIISSLGNIFHVCHWRVFKRYTFLYIMQNFR